MEGDEKHEDLDPLEGAMRGRLSATRCIPKTLTGISHPARSEADDESQNVFRGIV